MSFDFDRLIDRRGTNSIKHDFAQEYGKPDGLLPLWVADMDFKSAPQITEALIKAAEFSIFGYTDTGSEYFESVMRWFKARFGYEFKQEWLVKTHGVVYSICAAIRALTEVSDAVLIQPPVYHPFKSSIEANGRKMVTNPLRYTDGRYHVDFEDFEKKITENAVKLFILCSPHNPVGRVWSADELRRMGDICLKHGVIIISDEIHCDFVYEGNKHTVFSSISDEFRDNSVICTAPSKTFNLAGLQAANTFIANESIRKKFMAELNRNGLDQPNMMGLAACQSAYEHGGSWVDALLRYLSGNICYIRDFLNSELKGIKLVEPEGTYLIWLDMSALASSGAELDELIVNKARLWVNEGTIFGREGEGFIRINIAAPRTVIETAMQRLKSAVR